MDKREGVKKLENFAYVIKGCPLPLVAVPPRVYPSPPDGNYVVRSGSTVELVCNAEGSPQPAITWTRQGDSFSLTHSLI